MHVTYVNEQEEPIKDFHWLSLSLSLRYGTRTWTETACTPSRACRALATPVSTLLSGTLPLSATTRAGETISNSCTLTEKSKDHTLRDAWHLLH